MKSVKSSRRAHDSLVGEVLAGRYRIVKMLGKGGMGAVYEAVQEDLGRRVAVKVLHPFLSDDYEHITRFKREARAAASLGHPNVVQVTDFHSGKGELAFLVMEYLEGCSLRDVMKADGKLEVDRVVPIVLQVLSALGAAHAAGIVHRDLKPGNIFLIEVSGVGEIAKLLDFGIAKMTEGTGYTMLTRTGVTLGTPVYMAPEQVTGRQIDARTDIYAIGVITYRALAGRAPFKSTDVGDLLRQVLIEPTPPLRRYRPDLDQALADVVERAIAKVPVERYQSTAAMAEALQPWSRGRRITPSLPVALPMTAGEPLEPSDPEDSRIETILARPTPTGERDPAPIEMPTAPDLAAPMEAAEAAIAAAIAADAGTAPRSPRSTPRPASAPALPPLVEIAPLEARAEPTRPRRGLAAALMAVAAVALVALATAVTVFAVRSWTAPASAEPPAEARAALGVSQGASATTVAPATPPPPGAPPATPPGPTPGPERGGGQGDAGAAAPTPTPAPPAPIAPPSEAEVGRQAPVRCGEGDVLTLEDVLIDHPRGTAVQAGRGCRLTLRRCILRGRRFGVQARDGAIVRVEGCTLWGRRFGLHVTGESTVEVVGSEISGRSGALQTTGHSRVVLRGTRVRGRVFEGSSRVERID